MIFNGGQVFPLKTKLNVLVVEKLSLAHYTYRTHERVEDADRESCSTGERLRHVELGARVVIVILVEELDVGVIA